ncbi:MAG TPA: hypothetical protein V6D25_00995 [Leptolyngbyaceae cyanobacterium]
MNTTIELPSGKILNITRFIALLPVSSNQESNYHLILEGYPHPIELEFSDAQVLKSKLELDNNHHVHHNQPGWDQEAQIRKNQRAMKILAERIEKNKNMSDTESLERQQFFEQFKKNIDADRPPGQKLYSDS